MLLLVNCVAPFAFWWQETFKFSLMDRRHSCQQRKSPSEEFKCRLAWSSWQHILTPAVHRTLYWSWLVLQKILKTPMHIYFQFKGQNVANICHININVPACALFVWHQCCPMRMNSNFICQIIHFQECKIQNCILKFIESSKTTAVWTLPLHWHSKWQHVGHKSSRTPSTICTHKEIF